MVQSFKDGYVMRSMLCVVVWWCGSVVEMLDVGEQRFKKEIKLIGGGV